jgi:hypothetical protein
VHRPHRHLHRECQQEGNEDQHLLGHAERQPVEIQDAEAAGLQIHVDQRNQHEHRAEKGVQEELDGGIYAPRSAPDADNQEHRHQHRLPEYVEQHRIQRREYAVHQAFHDQEGGHVLCGFLLDHLPAGQHHQHRGEGGQDDQRHGNTIHTEVVVGIEGTDPRQQLLELHLRRAHIKVRVQQGTGSEGDQRYDQRRLPAGSVAQGVHHQQHDAAGNRQPDQCTEQWKVNHAPAPGDMNTNQNSINSRPIIMLKA